MRITELLFTLLISAILLSGCSSTPENKQKTKGQIISKCLDHQSPEQCDKKYNP